MKRTLWIVLLTVVVFLSAVVLGITTVFRVDEVTLIPQIVSEDAEEETLEMHQLLEEAYVKRSAIKADASKAEEIVDRFPYFRLTKFEVAYPNRIEISVVEEIEFYAVPIEDSDAYYVLGNDGVVLGIRDSYLNRLDGAENVLLCGLEVVGQKGGFLEGDECVTPVIEFCQYANQALEGIRRNVVFVEVLRGTSKAEDTVLKVTMKEGIKLYIRNPFVLLSEKTSSVIEKYFSLTPEQRLTGRIAVSDQEGSLILGYASEDEFDR